MADHRRTSLCAPRSPAGHRVWKYESRNRNCNPSASNPRSPPRIPTSARCDPKIRECRKADIHNSQRHCCPKSRIFLDAEYGKSAGFDYDQDHRTPTHTSGGQLNEDPAHIGIIIVDHGSRRRESNEMLHAAAAAFAAQSQYVIVEPAHMELAEPTIANAFQRCVERGAKQVIVFPYFLSPGRHWTEDIPALVEEAAKPFANVRWLVTAPFGLHPGMLSIINDRIRMCQDAAMSNSKESVSTTCDVCGDGRSCQFRTSSQESSSN